MAEPQTVNGGLIVPNTGDLVGTWGSAALNPDFVAIDGFLCGVQTISVGSSPITLTAPAGFTPTPSGGPTQAQNMALKFTGTLTTSVTVTLPLPGMYIIHNLLSGGFQNFALILAAAGSGQVVSTCPGSAQRIYNDGTNVYLVDLPPVGSFLDLYTASVPAWINACTVPPYLYCNGSTFNGTTYPFLAALLGTLSLPDLRGRSRAAFNDGTNRITAAGSGVNGDAVGSAGGQQNVTLGTSNLPPYTPGGTPACTGILLNGSTSITLGTPSAGGFAPGSGPQPGANGVTVSATLGTFSFNGNPQGGSSIPFTNMSPVTIAGIMLIRAA